MAYDTREAAEILAHAHEERRQAEGLTIAERQRRTDAAAELLEAVVGVLKAAGFEVNEENQHEPSISEGYFLLRFKPEEHHGVWLSLSRLGGSAAPEAEKPAIEYSPSAKAWVGKAQDTFFVPTPGEPFARRSAAGAVADAIVRTLAKVRPSRG